MLAGLLGLEPRLAEPESAVLPIERQPNNEVVYLSVSPSVVNGKCARVVQFFFHARNLLKSRDEALPCGCGAWPGGMPGAKGPPLRRGFANAKFRTMLGPSASDTRRIAPRAALTARRGPSGTRLSACRRTRRGFFAAIRTRDCRTGCRRKPHPVGATARLPPPEGRLARMGPLSGSAPSRPADSVRCHRMVVFAFVPQPSF